MKRAFDIVVAGVLLVLVLPALLLAAVAVAISLRAWPFFTHDRIGLDGRPFRFVKLRTLPVHAPRYADKYAVAEHESSAPPICRALRRLHLDELPQLWLVVIGRMSLVGPRPEMPHLHRDMDPAFARLRTSVRPGCTGLWQISEASTGLIAEAPEYDEHYVRHAGLFLDLWIALRTLALVRPFGRPQFVTLGEVRGTTIDLRDVTLREIHLQQVEPAERVGGALSSAVATSDA